MATAGRRSNLHACEVLLGHIIDMVVDVEGFARDGGLADIEERAQHLMRVAADVLTAIQSQLQEAPCRGNTGDGDSEVP